MPIIKLIVKQFFDFNQLCESAVDDLIKDSVIGWFQEKWNLDLGP